MKTFFRFLQRQFQLMAEHAEWETSYLEGEYGHD